MSNSKLTLQHFPCFHLSDFVSLNIIWLLCNFLKNLCYFMSNIKYFVLYDCINITKNDSIRHFYSKRVYVKSFIRVWINLLYRNWRSRILKMLLIFLVYSFFSVLISSKKIRLHLSAFTMSHILDDETVARPNHKSLEAVGNYDVDDSVCNRFNL